jgi:hypothetical protein
MARRLDMAVLDLSVRMHPDAPRPTLEQFESMLRSGTWRPLADLKDGAFARSLRMDVELHPAGDQILGSGEQRESGHHEVGVDGA